MRDIWRSSTARVLSLGLGIAACTVAEAPQGEADRAFDVVEATIADIHWAMQEGRVTARSWCSSISIESRRTTSGVQR
jgi:hypothetical protein